MVDVGDVSVEDVADRGRILGDRLGAVDVGRGVVDLDGEGAGIGQGAVGDRVGDERQDAGDEAAGEARIGREGVGTVGTDVDRADRDASPHDGSERAGRVDGAVVGVVGDRELGDRQGVAAFDVGVIGSDGAVEDAAEARRSGGTADISRRIVGRDRGVVDGRDVQAEDRRIGERRAVGVHDRVGDERDRAIVIGGRDEDEAAVGVQGQLTASADEDGVAGGIGGRVARDREGGDREGAVDVGVVGEDRARVGRVFDGGEVVVGGDRGVGHGGDGQGERARVGVDAVGKQVTDDRDRSVPIGGRREGISARVVDDDRADGDAARGDRGDGTGVMDGVVTGHRERDHGKDRGLRVAVVRQDVAVIDAVLVKGRGIIAGHGRVIDLRDGDVELRGSLAAEGVLDRVGDFRDRAGETGDGIEQVGAVVVEREVAHAVDGDGDAKVAGTIDDERGGGVAVAVEDVVAFDGEADDLAGLAGVGVGVVGEDAAGKVRKLEGRGRVVVGDGRRIDDHRQGAGDVVRVGVGGDLVADGVGHDRNLAIPRRSGGRDRVAAVGVDADRAHAGHGGGGAGRVLGEVAGDGELMDEQVRVGLAAGLLDVRVVGKDVAGDGSSRGSSTGLAGDDRHVVDGRDDDGEGDAGGGAGLRVGHVVRTRDGTVPVQGAEERVRTVVIEGERADGGRTVHERRRLGGTGESVSRPADGEARDRKVGLLVGIRRDVIGQEAGSGGDREGHIFRGVDRVRGDGRSIVGTGDRDRHRRGSVVIRFAAVVGGLDRVGQGEHFACVEEVEGLAVGIKRPGDRGAGGAGGDGRLRAEAQHRQQVGFGDIRQRGQRRGTDRTGNRDRGGRDRDRVGDVDVGDVEGGRARDRQGGIRLGRAAFEGGREGDDRRVVRAGDGDRDRLGSGTAVGIRDSDVVGDRDDLAGGEVLRQRVVDREGPSDRAVVESGYVTREGERRAQGVAEVRREGSTRGGGSRPGGDSGRGDIAVVEIGEGKGARRVEAAGGKVRRGVLRERGIHYARRDDRIVVRAGDGDRDQLVDRNAGAVADADRVGEDQRLAQGEEVEGLGTGVEAPIDRPRGGGGRDDGSVDRQVAQQRGRGRRARARVVAADREGVNRGVHLVADVEVLDGKRARRRKGRVGLGQTRGGAVARAHRDHRRVVRAVDGDRDRLGAGGRLGGLAGIVREREGVLEDERLAGGEEVELLEAGVERPGEGAGTGGRGDRAGDVQVSKQRGGVDDAGGVARGSDRGDGRGNDVAHVEVLDGDGAGSRQGGVTLGEGNRGGVARDEGDRGLVVRAGDRDRDRLVVGGRRTGVVRGGDRIGEDDRLAGGEETEVLRAGVERPVDRARGGGGGDDRGQVDAEVTQVRGGVERACVSVGAGDGDGGSGNRDHVGEIDVLDGKRAGGGEGRIRLGQAGRIVIGTADGDDRRIVRAGDGDGDVVRVAGAAVIDRDPVGDRDGLADGEVLRQGIGDGEVPGERAVVGTGGVGSRKAERGSQRAAEVRGYGSPGGGGGREEGDGGRGGVVVVDIREADRAGGEEVAGGVALGDGAGGIRSGDVDDRRVVRAGDGDRDRLGSGTAVGIRDSDVVGDRDDLAGGEVLRQRVVDREGPSDRAVVESGYVTREGERRAQGVAEVRREGSTRGGGSRPGGDSGRGDIAVVEIGEGKGARRVEAAGGKVRRGVLRERGIHYARRDDRIVVRAGDGDRDQLVDRNAGAVADADRVGEDQRLAQGEEVEGLGTGVESPLEATGHIRARDVGLAGDREVVQQGRGVDGARGVAAERDRGDRGRQHVAEVEVGDRKGAGAAGEVSRVLGDEYAAAIAPADRDDRLVVRAGDSDGDRLVVRSSAVGDLHRVGEDQGLAGGEEIELLSEGVELPLERAGDVGTDDVRLARNREVAQQRRGVDGAGAREGAGDRDGRDGGRQRVRHVEVGDGERAGCGGQARGVVLGERGLGAIAGGDGDDRHVVRAGDRDRDVLGDKIVTIGERDGVSDGQDLAVGEQLSVVVVQREGPVDGAAAGGSTNTRAGKLEGTHQRALQRRVGDGDTVDGRGRVIGRDGDRGLIRQIYGGEIQRAGADEVAAGDVGRGVFGETVAERTRSDDGRVVGAGDEHADGLGVRAAVAVGDFDGVKQGDRFVVREVVEDRGRRVEGEGDGAGRVGVALGDGAQRSQGQQGRGVHAVGGSVRDRDVRDEGRVADISEVDVAKAQAGGVDQGGGIRLLAEEQAGEIADIEDRSIIRTGDGDGHRLGVIVRAIRDLDSVLDGDRLAEGEVIEDAGIGAEGELDHAQGASLGLGDSGRGDETKERSRGETVIGPRGDLGSGQGDGLTGLVEVEIAEGQVDRRGERAGVRLFGQADRGVRLREDRPVVRAGDRDGDGLVGDAVLRVRDPDGIREDDGLSIGEEIEGFGAGVEEPVELTGGHAVGTSGHAIRNGEVRLQRGRVQRADVEIRTGNREGMDRGGEIIRKIDVLDGQHAGRGQGRVSLTEIKGSSVETGDGNDRIVIGAGDRDSDRLGIGATHEVVDLDGILDGDLLAEGQVVEDARTGAEGEVDAARRVAGHLGDREDADQVQERRRIQAVAVGGEHGRGNDAGGMSDLIQVDIAEGERQRSGEGRGIGLFGEGDDRVGDRQHRRVIGAGNRQGDDLVDRVSFSVRDPDGVLDGDGLAISEIVEHSRIGAEGDGNGPRCFAGILGQSGDADQVQERGGIQGGGIGPDRRGGDAGADDRGGMVGVAEVDIGERQVPGGRQGRGVGLFGDRRRDGRGREDRGVVDLGDGDRDVGGVGKHAGVAQDAVGDGVGDGREGVLRVEVVEVQRRREGQRAVGGDADRALISNSDGSSRGVGRPPDGETGDGLGVGVGLDVVDEEVPGQAGGGVFGEGEGVVDRVGRVVDADVQRGGGRQRAVGHRIGDGRDVRDGRKAAGEACGRSEGVGARGVDHEGSLQGVRTVGAVDVDGGGTTGGHGDRRKGSDLEGGHRHRVAFDFDVIGEDVTADVREARDHGVGDRPRGVVHRGDGDRDRGVGGQLVAGIGVGDDVGDGRERAVEVRQRDEIQGAVGIDAQRADVGDDDLAAEAGLGEVDVVVVVVRDGVTDGDRARDARDGEGLDLEGRVDGFCVGIIGEQADGVIDGQRGGFGHDVGVGAGGRGAVDGRDDEGEGRLAGGAARVADGVVDDGRTVPVRSGSEGILA